MFEKELTIKYLQLEATCLAALRENFISDYPEFTNKKLTPADILAIAKPLPSLELDHLDGITIYAVFAIETGVSYESLVIASNGCYRVNYPTDKVIARLVNYTSNIHFHKTFCCVMARVFKNENLRYIPYVGLTFTLMPLGATTSPKTSWINPVCIKNCSSENNTLALEYSFGLTVECQVKSEKALASRMCLAFQSFAIYLRDNLPRPLILHQPLASFLRISMTDMVTQVLGNLTVNDIPGERGDFDAAKRGFYREMYDRYDGDLEMLKRML